MDSAHAQKKALSDRRLFVPQLSDADCEILLPVEAAKHALVLRLVAGDEVVLFDGQGRTCAARISSLSRAALRCVLLGPMRRWEPGPSVVLVQCVPKAGKLDDIVRMTTELGVAEIRLAVSERCVSRGHDGRGAHKVDRLARIAIEAARQSEQAFVPPIVAAEPLRDVLASAPRDALRLACVERHGQPLGPLQGKGAVWVAVGPEGGFGPTDREELDAAGCVPVGFGSAILRTETAAVVGVVLVLDRLRQRR